MATFGIPAAHEDDPARAIRAALAFQAELREADRAPQARGGGSPRLPLRVGINTGRVMVGALTGARGSEASIVGDVVNVAARLEQACLPGDVLVSHETYRQVRGLFDVDPEHPISVKGNLPDRTVQTLTVPTHRELDT